MVKIQNYYQTPKIIPLGAWTPDQPDLNNPGVIQALNVYPKTPSSYGPVPAPAEAGVSALDGQALGLFAFRDKSDIVHYFAGTADKLYHLLAADTSWEDVTRASPSPPYAATTASPWVFVPFDNSVLATDQVDTIQIFTIGSSTAFTALSADAPHCFYMAAIKNFLMLANTYDTTNGSKPQRVWWSAIGDPSTWPTIGTNAAIELQSDVQDLRADLGWITGIVSNLTSAHGAVLLESGCYSVNYIGSPVIFDFEVIQGAVGCQYPRSILVNQGVFYYYGTDGFWSCDGITPNPIGAQKINNWFLTDPNDGVDPLYLDRIQGAPDPFGQLVMWIYCGPSSSGLPNRMLIYNWLLQRWSVCRVSMNWIAKGYTF